jgi:hypothetical protein
MSRSPQKLRCAFHRLGKRQPLPSLVSGQDGVESGFQRGDAGGCFVPESAILGLRVRPPEPGE